MTHFDYFVVFAEMRTGSNFLESNLNCFEGISCLGEAFNPFFIGYPNSESVLGITQAQRENNPHLLLDAIQSAEGLNGFRYFNDHDQRILDRILNDHRCAKIVLTRNPVESFVSWKIAAETGQWKLTNVKHAKTDKVSFDPLEFQQHLQQLQDFQLKLLKGMQHTGQTAFYVAYEDLQDVEVFNGMARFLGKQERIEQLDNKLKKQNPSSMANKVKNYDEMRDALRELDQFGLTRTPNFEPRRGPMVPRYVAGKDTPLLFLPIRSGPEKSVLDWMAAIDKTDVGQLQSGFNQNALRKWMRATPSHRSFTVLRHPVARAHSAFCEHFLNYDAGGFADIRKALKTIYGLNLPNRNLIPEEDQQYDIKAHQEAFLAFLKFLKSNLNSQTSQRVDPAWASQSMLLQGMSEFAPADFIFREDELANDLRFLSELIGRAGVHEYEPDLDQHHERLGKIYNEDIEKAARDAYSRDYLLFGFSDWAG